MSGTSTDAVELASRRRGDPLPRSEPIGSNVSVATHVYRPDIDGLRALAVLAVLAYHAFPSVLAGGFIGVDVFFVISGYLISGLLFADLAKGRFSIGNFYARRVRRIFPALALVLGVCLIAGWCLLYAEEFRRLGKHVAAGALFVSNIAFWRESDYFDPEASTKPLLHLWSLGVEEQFYLLWPVLLWWFDRRGIRPALGVGLVVAVSLAACIVTSTSHATAAFYAPWTRLWELGIGGALALAGQSTGFVLRGGVAADLRAGAGVLLIAVALWSIDDGQNFPGLLALLPVMGAALLISAGPEAWINRVVLSRRLLVAIGLVSFPLYLWHWPALAFLRIVTGEMPSAGLRWAALGLALVLAVATFFFVERPIRRRAARTTVVALVALVAALGAAGALVYGRYGFVERPVNRPFVDAGLSDYYLSRQSDDSCPEYLGARPVAEEVCLANGAVPRTLFVGDSHAMALYSGIHVGRFEAPAALVAGHSCALYPTLVYEPTHRQRWGNNCTAIARQALAVAAASPSIRTVFIATKMPAFDASTAHRASRYRPAAGAPAVDEVTAFREGTGALVDALLKDGKRVVLMLPVPEFPRPPTGCEARLDWVSPHDCRIPRSDASSALFRDEVRSLQARYPRLEVFDPSSLICDATTCSAKRGADYLYHDEQHLSIAGSLLLLRALNDARLLD